MEDPQYPGWHLMPVEAMVLEDRGNKHDQNGDGYICQRFIIGQTNKHGFGRWTNRNHRPLVRLPQGSYAYLRQ